MTSASPSQLVPKAPVAAIARLLAWCFICTGAPLLILDDDKPKLVTRVPDRPVMGPNDTGPVMSVAADGLDIEASIAQLKAERPEYIAVGNSMIFSRFGVSPEKMNKLTGHKFSFLLRGGSTPGAWYLTLKHIVAASGVKPKLVFFMCRDTELTSPYANTNDLHTAYLNNLKTPQERAAARMLREPKQESLYNKAVGRVSAFFTGPEGIYNFTTRPAVLQARVTNIAMRGGYVRRVQDGDRRAMTERFGLDHLRRDVPSDMGSADTEKADTSDNYQSPRNRFVAPDDSSLLPPMMQLAKEHGIKTLFFRVKRRPMGDGGTVAIESPKMRPYVKELQAWIEQHGGLFYDETYDPAMKLEAYNDGDHIGEEHRDWYRKYFWQRAAPLFP